MSSAIHTEAARRSGRVVADADITGAVTGRLSRRSGRRSEWVGVAAALALLLGVGGLGLGRASAGTEAFGHAQASGLDVSGAYIRVARHPSVDDAGDGYLTIVNRSGHPAQLDAATTPAAASVVLHHGVLASGGPSNGAAEHLYCGLAPGTPTGQLVALRTDIDPLVVPAGATITIAPGHAHFALTRLLAPARRGARVPLSLYLDSGARIDVLVPIR